MRNKRRNDDKLVRHRRNFVLADKNEIVQKIPLYDDDTEYCGKSHADEMLDEFMEEIELPFGSPLERALERVNESLKICLKKCGLEPYTMEQIKQLTLTH